MLPANEVFNLFRKYYAQCHMPMPCVASAAADFWEDKIIIIIIIIIITIIIIIIIIIIILSFTAKIDSEKHNGDETDDRMLADRLYSCSSRVAGKYTRTLIWLDYGVQLLVHLVLTWSPGSPSTIENLTVA